MEVDSQNGEPSEDDDNAIRIHSQLLTAVMEMRRIKKAIEQQEKNDYSNEWPTLRSGTLLNKGTINTQPWLGLIPQRRYQLKQANGSSPQSENNNKLNRIFYLEIRLNSDHIH